MDPVKIAGIINWPMLSTKKEVWSFAGFVNFYYRCGEWCPSAFKSFELPSWMLYQAVQLLWDSGLLRGESGYSL
jgi:hypothetical protein